MEGYRKTNIGPRDEKTRKNKSIKRMLRIILILEIICLLELWAVISSWVEREHMIEMRGISQSGIPTGCESVSTVMVLQHLGIEITLQMFIDNYLPRQKFYRVGDTLFGPDPQEFFAGNPYEKNSLGCFLADGERIAYEKELVEKRYEEMGKCAVVVVND